MGDALTYLQSEVEGIFKGENIDGYDYKLTFNFTVAESLNQADEDDHLIVFADMSSGEKGATRYGSSSGIPGNVLFVNADQFEKDPVFGPSGSKTTAHELGHLLGLEHTKGGGFSGNFNNLMQENPEWFIDSKNVSDEQFKSIATRNRSGNHDKVKYNEFGYPDPREARGVSFPSTAYSKRRTKQK